MIPIKHLITESRNEASQDIDQASTLDLVRVINEEDKKVALAVETALPQIARAIDTIVARLNRGGRLFYIGAGTSGRLGILDASECPPTYGTAPELVQGIIAGGIPAVFQSQEGAEDSAGLGAADLKTKDLQAEDIVVGLAASGRTPYVIGALRYAAKQGAATIAISCNPGSAIAREAQIEITAAVGPEVVSGSTRMKAGTAQKMILNMLSTGTMIRRGKVYGNLMVDVKASNEKLQERACRIVMEASGASREDAQQALRLADNQAKLAILLLKTGLVPEKARQLLAAHNGFLAAALESFLKEVSR